MAGFFGVVVLDGRAHAGQLDHLVVGEHQPAPVLLGRGHVLGGLLGVGGVDHLDRLVAHLAHDDGLVALLEGGFEHVPLVGVHRALDHVLAQAPGPGDVDGVPESGLGVDGEHDPAAGQIGADHLLHCDGQVDREVVEVFVFAVADGPVGEQGGEAAAAGVQQVLHAPDVQVGLLLAGEAGVGQVLGRGRRAHGHVAALAVLVLQIGVGLLHRLAQVPGELQVADQGPDLGAAVAQVVHVRGVEVGEDVPDAVQGAGSVQEAPVSFGRDGEAVRDVHVLFGQVAVHFAQAGVLAAHDINVVVGQVLQPDDVGVLLVHGGPPGLVFRQRPA